MASYQFLKSQVYQELKTPPNVIASLEIGFTPESSRLPVARDMALYYLLEVKRLYADYPEYLDRAKKSLAFSASIQLFELKSMASSQHYPAPFPLPELDKDADYSDLPF
ncbi:hypothetical protein HHU12_21495 [Flammeovirga aprica JL-4]|uniref:Uncharacterized protein n=1 Tax=Flammeovirga aprica JL-4 TaxID=694437 RepID=A0A7X9RXM8_9BACT|nr:hypothetical protein [Flammeovirga aprica JL-4]